MTIRIAATLSLALVVAGCVTVSGDPVPEAPGTNDQSAVTPQPAATTGSAANPGSGGGSTGDRGLCSLFTSDEIAAYVGTPVDGGLANPQVHTCVWSALEGDGYAFIQQVPAEFYEEHTLSAGYHKITGIGEEASIENALLGEGLGLTVRSGDSAYFADLVPATDDQQVIDFGRDFITRAGGQP
jgi:hypothetical protein